MKNALTVMLAIAGSGVLNAAAQTQGPDFYGRLHLAYVGADEGDERLTQLDSYASRVGVKGSHTLEDAVWKVTYQVEYQVPADGDGDFSPRDILLGLAGPYGQLQLGRSSTPLRNSQGKFDLFNDQLGDLSIYTPNENRVDDIVMYTSPSAAGFNLQLAHIASEDDTVSNGTSAAVIYEQGGLYGALAYDRNVEAPDTDAVRATLVYQWAAWHLGLTAEQFSGADGSDTDAVVGSVAYALTDQWRLKLQYGVSDIVREDRDGLSLGVDYQWDKNLRLFAFYTQVNADEVEDLAEQDDQYLALGAEFRFGR